jgi:hypothetical protein
MLSKLVCLSVCVCGGGGELTLWPVCSRCKSIIILMSLSQ